MPGTHATAHLTAASQVPCLRSTRVIPPRVGVTVMHGPRRRCVHIARYVRTGQVKPTEGGRGHAADMPYKERHRDRGARRARVSLAEVGRELRLARLATGLRQRDVADAAGIHPSWVSRVERGLADEAGLRLLSILAAIVGLDLSVRAFPGGQPLRDEGHRRLLSRIRALLPDGAPWQTEVPLPRHGDKRAWDAMTRLWNLRTGIEAELRPSDLQALARKIALKRRDGGVDRMFLILADTRHNRALLRLVGDELRVAFPLQGSAARAALRANADPGCDLLFLA